MPAIMQETRAIIVRLTKLGDTSWIVHWLTESHGLVKTVAKAARLPKSPFSGKIDLFFGGEISYQTARRGELHALREITITEWRLGLRSGYARTLMASYCCQLLEAAMLPDHPEPAAHNLLHRALNHLDQSIPSRKALFHYERELAKILGVLDATRPAEASLRESLLNLPHSRIELLSLLP